jgi:hypothetical protein
MHLACQTRSQLALLKQGGVFGLNRLNAYPRERLGRRPVLPAPTAYPPKPNRQPCLRAVGDDAHRQRLDRQPVAQNGESLLREVAQRRSPGRWTQTTAEDLKSLSDTLDACLKEWSAGKTD